MGIEGPLGVVATLIGFVVLFWMIRQIDKEMGIAKVFTPPSSTKLSDWAGWLIVVAILLGLFFTAINSIVTGENGCEPGEYIDKWGNCV
jgi:uncharacterized membrane protein (DUF106 family)